MPKYDLTVIGAGIGGLAAAALAARMHKKTIVLEPGATLADAMGLYARRGFLFSSTPTLSFGFERGGAFQQLSEELGISLNASLRSPCFQIALPDRRITIYAEQSETLEELRREFPREIDSIARFYKDLRKQAVQISKNTLSQFFSQRRSAAGFIRKFGFNREFIAFLDLQSYYFFNKPASALTLHSLIRLCDSSPYRIEQGFRKLAEKMVDVLLKNEGEIRYNSPLVDIAFTAKGIATTAGKFDTDAVLVNTEQQSDTFFLCLGLQEEAIPVKMNTEVLCLSEYSPPGRFFSLSLNEMDDRTTAPPGMRALIAGFSSSFGTLTAEEGIQHVERLIPFLNDFITFSEICKPANRKLQLSGSFKTVRTGGDISLLYKSSKKGQYLLPADAGTPEQAIIAAQRLSQQIR